jgi:hypothetical protein
MPELYAAFGASVCGPSAIPLVYDPGDIRARDRADTQLPSTPVGMLGQPRADTCLLEQAAHDRRPAVAFAPGPAHVDPEPSVIQRPDGQPVRSSGAEIVRHV